MDVSNHQFTTSGIKLKPHLFTTARKYQGYHVAYASFNSRNVIAYGKNPAKVLDKALNKGFSDAVLSYVPEENMTLVY